MRRNMAFAAAIAGILGPFLALAIYYAERESKGLALQVISRAVVADLSDPALANLQLYYQGEALKKVTAVTIDLSNSGTVPLRAEDFERALGLRFPGASPVIAAVVAEKRPLNLNPDIEVGSSVVSIAPLLLNPGDRIRLTVHLRDASDPEVDARIVGIDSVNVQQEEPPLERRWLAMLAVGYLLMVVYAFVGFLVLRPWNWDWVNHFVFIAIGFAAVLMQDAALQGILGTKPDFWTLVSPNLIFYALGTALAWRRRHSASPLTTQTSATAGPGTAPPTT